MIKEEDIRVGSCFFVRGGDIARMIGDSELELSFALLSISIVAVEVVATGGDSCVIKCKDSKSGSTLCVTCEEFAKVAMCLQDKSITYDVFGNPCVRNDEMLSFNLDKSAADRALAHDDIAKPLKSEQVEHPSHYAWLKELCGVEPIDICRHFDFSVGNALKYLMRKGKVDGDKTEAEKRVEDLKKAVFYLQDEIKRLENGKEEG